MPRFKGRPPARTFTIENCSSVTLYDNPSPRCPHGLRWRESDADQMVPEAQALMCAECEATEYHPHEGERITLSQPRTFRGRDPIRRVYLAAIADEIGERPADFVTSLVEAVKDSVVDWTWKGTDGECLPLPKDDWGTVAEHVEYPEVLWIIEAALRGADPRLDLYRPPALASGKDSLDG